MPNIDRLDGPHTCYEGCPCHWIKDLEDFVNSFDDKTDREAIYCGWKIIHLARERLR